MKPQGDSRRERLMQELDYLIARGQQVADEIRQVDEAGGRHRVERPRLKLIRGGKALALAPFGWAWAQVRDHTAAAAPLAAAGLIGGAATLGVANPVIHPDAPPRSTTIVEREPEARSVTTPTVLPPPTPQPMPASVPLSETTPPLGPMPEALIPTPTPTPTLTPTPTPEPVEDIVDEPVEVVWTKVAALAHCREVLREVSLRECVAELLAR